MLGITGSNLTDLARNALLNDQQVGNEFAQADERGIRRQQLQAAQNQFLQDLALRRQQADQQNALANNALLQQGRIADMQWNSPNATTIAQGQNQLAIAKMPWTQGMTPEQTAQNALAQQQIDIQKMPYDLMQQGKWVTPNGPMAQAQGQLLVDKAQRAERMDSAVKAANGAYLSTVDMPHPWDSIWFGDRNTKIANGVRSQLSSQLPEVNELIFDPKANGGKGGFVSPDMPQAPVANPFAVPSQPAAAPAPFTPSLPNNGGIPVSTYPQFQNGGNQFASPRSQAPKPLDVDTARQFLQQAGGDAAKARALAAAAGYSF